MTISYNPVTGEYESGTSLVHVAVPIAFDTEGLSVPVDGVIPGVPIYDPAPGDVLVDAWFEITEAFNGTLNVNGDVGSYATTAYGLWGFSTSPLPLTIADDPDDSGANKAGLPSLSSAGVGGGYRLAPTTLVGDPLVAVVSTDGKNDGDDPESTEGAAIVHLLILPAA